MAIHKLKTWMPIYELMENGKKTFDYRKNDRNFKVGDQVVFQEYNQNNGQYTGKEFSVTIKFLLHGGSFGIPRGYCIMSLPPRYITLTVSDILTVVEHSVTQTNREQFTRLILNSNYCDGVNDCLDAIKKFYNEYPCD